MGPTEDADRAEIPVREAGGSDESEGESAPDIVDESRFFVLGLTDSGWGVWARGNLSGEPVASFPPDDDGFSLAQDEFDRRNRSERIRRGHALDVARWAAFIAGALWVFTTAVFVFMYTTIPDNVAGPGTPFDRIKWWEAAAQVSQPLFIVCLGTYVILWLRARQP
jgi:hypothetical protein